MADLTFSTGSGNQVKPIDPQQMEVYDGLLPSTDAPANGDAVYFHATTGRLTKASATVEGTANVAGLVVQTNGRAASFLVRGRVAGFNVSSLNYGAPIYASDTAGKLADAPGTTNRQVGIVVPMSDRDATKVIYFNAPAYIPVTIVDEGGDG